MYCNRATYTLKYTGSNSECSNFLYVISNVKYTFKFLHPSSAFMSLLLFTGLQGNFRGWNVAEARGLCLDSVVYPSSNALQKVFGAKQQFSDSDQE